MRNMNLFLFGRFTSLFGSGLLIIALPIYILNESSSGASLGLFMALTVLPSLFLTPFLGNYLERLNRKYIMIIMDIIHFFLYFVLAYFDDLSMIQLGAFICVSMIVDKIFNISSTSIFSQIIEIDLVEKGNSFKSILDNIAQIISPLAGTMLYMTFGLKGIFYINSITFLISAISEIFIVYNYEKIESNKKKIFENMSEIYHLILKNLTLKKLFITIMLLNFIVSPLSTIVLPYLLLKVHDFSSQQFGLLNSAYMFGSVLGATMIIVRKNKMKLIKLLNMTSILYILIGVFGHLFSGANVELFLIVFIIQLLMGATVSMVNIPLITSLQLIIPNKMQVRFFSIMIFVSGLLIPLGEAILGFLVDRYNSHIIIIISSLFLIVITSMLLGNIDINKESYNLETQ